MSSKARAREHQVRHSTKLSRAAARTVGALLLSSGASYAATVTSTWNTTGTGNWTDPTHWTNTPAANTYPDDGRLNNTYDVIVNQGTATLDTTVSVHSLTLSGTGTIESNTTTSLPSPGTNSINVSGGFALGGHYLSANVNVAATGTFTLTDAATTKIVASSISVAGQMLLAPTTGTYTLDSGYNGATIKLLPTAVFTLDRPLTFAPPSNDPFSYPVHASLDNSGLILQTADLTLPLSPWRIDNSGTFRANGVIRAGTFRSTGLFELQSASADVTLSNSTLGGRVTIAEGAHLTLTKASGAINTFDNLSLTNAGSMQILSDLVVTGPSVISSPGTINLTTTATLKADLSLNGPTVFDGTTIQGTYRASVSNLTFKSGKISTSELYVPAAGTLTFSGTNARNLDRATVTVAGNANWDGTGSVQAGGFGPSRMRIEPSGTLTIVPSVTAQLSHSSGSPSDNLVSNAGTLNVDQAALTADYYWKLDNSGTIRVAGGSVTLKTSSATNSGTIDLKPGGYFLANTPLANSGVIHVNGGTFVVDAYKFYNSGTLRIDSGSARFSTPTVNSTDIELNPGGSLVVEDSFDNFGVIHVNGGSFRTSYLSTFSNSGTLRIDAGFARLESYSASTGTIELGAGGAAADFGPISTVRNLIVKGYHAGAWDGAGIVSVPARTNPAMAVGYALGSDVAKSGTWMGATVYASEILVRSTLLGDANLDGAVDFNDLVKLAQNYNRTISNTASSWFAGDFTYDNLVDFNDLVKLAQNYNSALPATPIPGASAAFENDLAAAFASVPEPAPLAWVLCAGAIGLTARRRRAPT